eukprot:PLAT6202.1.p2 GENE.PLAT6202.1~~PLAT6202.1.p2  ORF type:complete len:346 (-),score=213.60 PLAT6202.1:74-1111(-)
MRCSRVAAAGRTVLSGVQPSGVPHLGNYLGALRQWVQLADGSSGGTQGKPLFMLADLHAMTVSYDSRQLEQSVLTAAASLLALGLQPQQAAIFQQSSVRAHSELAWLLACHTPLAELQRMTQFKAKAAAGKAGSATLALFSYPVLQAADILVYRATHVPVGEDQLQHIELTRTIASAVCKAAGQPDLLPRPQPLLVGGSAVRVRSLRDSSKMSKSARSDASRINLTDDSDAIRRKVRRAKTDALPGITLQPQERPEVANLLTIFAEMTGDSAEAVAATWQSARMSDFKDALADAIIAHVTPIGKEMTALLADEAHLRAVLADGSSHAAALAEETMVDVRAALGSA